STTSSILAKVERSTPVDRLKSSSLKRCTLSYLIHTRYTAGSTYARGLIAGFRGNVLEIRKGWLATGEGAEDKKTGRY
ncbi:hypothetical protein, partial [Candidatus Electronema sp. PJ]|uniref:hypothetical protein n=1 Tax=Candidatus Electronema sp. PJ TaxID=3401572 RepID=UPI003AA82C31